MGESESAPSQTEGKFDGRPAVLHYQAEGDEAGLNYIEGYKVCTWSCRTAWLRHMAHSTHCSSVITMDADRCQGHISLYTKARTNCKR